MSLKTENWRRIAKSRPVCMGLWVWIWVHRSFSPRQKPTWNLSCAL
jgi:hypothetical protein